MHRRKLGTILASGLILASSLLAQTTTAPTIAQQVTSRVARLTTLLTLTTTQQAQATTIFTTQLTATAPIQTSIQTARTTLQTAVEKNDLVGITTQTTLIGNLTAQQLHASAIGDAAFYAILTPDQVTKYEQIEAHGPGGFGGPGGPGRGGSR